MSSDFSLHCVEIDATAEPTGTVIWLHGLGADGNDFVPVVHELGLRDRGVRFVLPHAPFRRITINGGAMMSGWYDIYALDGSRGEDAVGIRESEAQLQDLIDAEIARGVPAERIVLAGFSQGGAVVLHTALRYPERLAGVMALSTYLPLAETSADERSASSLDLPIFQAHGLEDGVILPEIAARSRLALEALGCAVEWHEYPMPHSVSMDEIGDIRDWLTQVLAL
ncbi:MAG: alpha/beta fold hydrolase [Gammaproteobacteria bacterium]|nr:alpha/beta fold hydrolase [Gammaproteobacteria bacterium]MCP5137322.1 alpha/beta fold hydrolase [Gammaproteobacteria bacterium]